MFAMASNIAKNKCPFAYMFILEIQFLITMFFTNKGCSQNILIIKFTRWNIQSIGTGQTSTSSTHRWIDVFFNIYRTPLFFFPWNLGISWNHQGLSAKWRGEKHPSKLWHDTRVPGTSSGSLLTMAIHLPFISIQPMLTDQRRPRSPPVARHHYCYYRSLKPGDSGTCPGDHRKILSHFETWCLKPLVILVILH